MLLKNMPRTAEHIAAIMAGKLMSDDMNTEYLLPNQMSMATALQIEMSVVRAVWSLLINKYKLIRTQKGVGTFRVPELSEMQKAINLEMIRQLQIYHTKAVFDSPWLHSLGIKTDADIRTALRLFREKSQAELSLRVLPELLEALSRFFRKLMSYPFSSAEICYVRSYVDMLTKACEVWCPSKRIIVAVSPVSAKVSYVLRKANRTLKTLGASDTSDPLSELETICQSNKVGLIYIGQMICYPQSYQYDASFWQRLQKIQQDYGFIILIDNPIPGQVHLPDLLKDHEAGTNQSVVILSKPSAHLLLSEINIIAGPAQGILKFCNKFKKYEPLASPCLTYALQHLLVQGKLQKKELLAYQELSRLIEEARDTLCRKEAFNDVYLQQQNSWYLYLELKNGNLFGNYYSRLQHVNIYVCNPGDYPILPHFKAGLLISFGYYSDVKILIKHLNRLLTALIPVSYRPLN